VGVGARVSLGLLTDVQKWYIFYTMISFEFDEQKSKSNRSKHGIDFVSAQRLWLDSNMLEISADTADEPRFLIVGVIERKHWSAIITYRVENIRIISVRRSRNEEVNLYES
jgi:uncharacterized DUF497 family protein